MVSGRKLSDFFFIHSLVFWSREKFEKEQSAGKRKFVPTSEKTFDPFTQFYKTFLFCFAIVSSGRQPRVFIFMLGSYIRLTFEAC
jgi:hypothetical protein